uniref:Uncharacterized protein n=1 Tax=Musca domestica TaxID=7370 RepID=A0A1I8MVX2_MUSDO
MNSNIMNHVLCVPAEHRAIHQLLIEWTKRTIWNSRGVLRKASVESQLKIFQSIFKVPKCQLYPYFWSDVLNYQMMVRTKIANEGRKHRYLVGTRTILEMCKNRINPAIYKKFMRQWKKRKPNETDNPDLKALNKYGLSNKEGSKEFMHLLESYTLQDFQNSFNVQKEIDDDVILIEEPVNCIDITMDSKDLYDDNEMKYKRYFNNGIDIIHTCSIGTERMDEFHARLEQNINGHKQLDQPAISQNLNVHKHKFPNIKHEPVTLSESNTLAYQIKEKEDKGLLDSEEEISTCTPCSKKLREFHCNTCYNNIYGFHNFLKHLAKCDKIDINIDEFVK